MLKSLFGVGEYVLIIGMVNWILKNNKISVCYIGY